MIESYRHDCVCEAFVSEQIRTSVLQVVYAIEDASPRYATNAAQRLSQWRNLKRIELARSLSPKREVGFDPCMHAPRSPCLRRQRDLHCSPVLRMPAAWHIHTNAGHSASPSAT